MSPLRPAPLRLARLRIPPLRVALLTAALSLLLGTACASVAAPQGWASPVRDGDALIVQTANGVVSALRLDNDSATPLWRYPMEGDDVEFKTVYATPVVGDGAVYLVSYSGTVVALDRASGRPLPGWPLELEQSVVATPVLEGKTLYVATGKGALFAVDVETGARKQLLQIDDRIWGRPASSGGHIYVAALDTQLRAIDRASGEVTWSQPVGTTAGDLLVNDGMLFVPSFDRVLRALDIEGGEERWAAPGDGWFWARPLVSGSVVYASTVAGSVYAFDREDGRELWRFHREDTEIRAAPVLADGVLIVASRDGWLYGIDAAAGTERWAQRREGERFLADPLVLESGVILVNHQGDLLRLIPDTGAVQHLLAGGQD